MEISWVVVGATLDDTLAQLDLEDTGEPVREGADEWAGAPLLARCEEPAVLARLVNQGRREMWELDPLDTTLSLVLAYVTANPHFAAMLAQADERLVKQSEQDATHYQRFEALLRRQGPPGTLEGRRVV